MDNELSITFRSILNELNNQEDEGNDISFIDFDFLRSFVKQIRACSTVKRLTDLENLNDNIFSCLTICEEWQKVTSIFSSLDNILNKCNSNFSYDYFKLMLGEKECLEDPECLINET